MSRVPYRRLKTISDYTKLKPKFIIAYDECFSYMGHDYGPPDPPPSMEYDTSATYLAMESEEEVLAWIKENQETKYGKPKQFKVFEFNPVNVTTEVKISFG